MAKPAMKALKPVCGSEGASDYSNFNNLLIVIIY